MPGVKDYTTPYRDGTAPRQTSYKKIRKVDNRTWFVRPYPSRPDEYVEYEAETIEEALLQAAGGKIDEYKYFVIAGYRFVREIFNGEVRVCSWSVSRTGERE